MGRVRSLFIKRAARNFIEGHPGKFTTEFEKNRRILDELVPSLSKPNRNRIAGYISTLLQQQKEE